MSAAESAATPPTIRISGATTVAAVIGDPVAHSLSPTVHNAAFAAEGLDWVFVALPTRAGGAAVVLDAMATCGLGGLSVTMPLKAEVAARLDRLDPLAAALGAVNCVARDERGLVGHNTDASGFGAWLATAGHPVAGARVVVVGAGGAGRAVVAGALGAGAASIVIVNRSPEPAAAAAALGPDRCSVGTLEDIATADVVVNATSVGMPSQPGCPVPEASLRPGQVVADLIYDPVDTELLRAAREVGAVALDGVGMLVHQAADAFRLWTGVEPPLAVMAAAGSTRR